MDWPATVSVPLRAPPVLAAAVKVTVAEPVPDVTLGVSQALLLLTIHAPHVLPAVIVTPALPPVSPNARVVGLAVITQAAAACDTLTVWPATVTVPLRAAPVLAAAVKVTVPEPLPEVALGVSHASLLLTVHAPHVLPAVTVTPALPPVSPNARVVGLAVMTHAAATWLTLTVCPATVTVPLRAAPVLGVAVNVTAPEPLPDVALGVSQALLLVTVQVPHVLPAVIVTPALPPVSPNARVVGLAVMTQAAATWLTLTVCPATVTAPLRAAPVLGVAVKVTAPEPLPDVALGVSQALLLVTVQVPHVLPAVIVTPALPPVSPNARVVGLAVMTQAAATWLTLTVCPATVTAPLRAAPVLGVAVKVTAPEPLPDVALGVSQALLLVTVQVPHVLPAVIVTPALPPVSPNARVVGLAVITQAAAACDTLTVWPATV